MARRRRRLSSMESGGEEHGGGSTRWVLTYADMITLLLAFFIMLYSMSILDLAKFRQVALSIKSGFGALQEGRPGAPGGRLSEGRYRPRQADETPKDLDRLLQQVEQVVKDRGMETNVKLRKDERGVVISLVTDKAIFPRGEAGMTTETKQVIDAIAGSLSSLPNRILVEGHTCDLPIQSGKYPSNWELSTARAAAVVRYLMENVGISADRLSASGYADSKPLVPNNCESNRALNRRVDIVILKTEDKR